MPLLLDAHVHFHPCFDRERFLDRAAGNFLAAAKGLGVSSPVGALLLTESAGARFFEELGDAALGGERIGRWSVAPTGEPESLRASRGGAPQLVIVAGRQIVTSEGLEVLALACLEEPPDGRSIAEAIEAVRRIGGVAVVPWGFGKWWLARGRAVASLLESENPRELFLGDNGSRPSWAPRPALFRSAEARGFRVLPGSDPLPFARHAGRAGSSGVLLRSDLDPERPAAAICAALADPGVALEGYREGIGVWPFLIDQLAMQWRKRSTRMPA